MYALYITSGTLAINLIYFAVTLDSMILQSLVKNRLINTIKFHIFHFVQMSLKY